MLSIEGIRRIENMVPLAEAVHNLEALNMTADEVNQAEKKLDNTRKMAEFARKEIENGFPFLHAHTLVGTWGALEATIEDLAVAVLLNDPSVRGIESISKIRVSLLDFESMNQESRMQLIVQELQRNLRADQRLGVNAFESLLSSIGLGGTIDDTISRTLFEFQQLRHAIVHRASIADKVLVERCPWLGLTIGQRLKLDHDDFHRLNHAVAEYLISIVERVRKKYPPVDHED